MNIYYPKNHAQHHPTYEFFNGEKINNSEIPQRLENVLQAISKTDNQIIPITKISDGQKIKSILSVIHDANYLDWLEQAKPTETLYPSVFNPNQTLSNHGHPSVQWGNFVTDSFTPLLPKTWDVAFTAAQCAYTATNSTLKTNETTIALVRPPGHHAGRSKVGGYCYLNNAAIAAQMLSTHGKVAILDVDYHHGNGTQDVFYDRSDVVTCSIHADPKRKFPYFAGLASEKGVGAGHEHNRNYPLATGITNTQYQTVLESAISWISNHNPKYLIISLGLDTHQSDPISDFELTTVYYQQMANTISELNLPTVVVLEGGYSTEAIGQNVVSFLSGLK
jgi:acetoin utilization deacetylase AcuC-like enzyme